MFFIVYPLAVALFLGLVAREIKVRVKAETRRQADKTRLAGLLVCGLALLGWLIWVIIAGPTYD